MPDKASEGTASLDKALDDAAPLSGRLFAGRDVPAGVRPAALGD